MSDKSEAKKAPPRSEIRKQKEANYNLSKAALSKRVAELERKGREDEKKFENLRHKFEQSNQEKDHFKRQVDNFKQKLKNQELQDLRISKVQAESAELMMPPQKISPKQKSPRNPPPPVQVATNQQP